MIDPNIVWHSLSQQTQKLMSLVDSDDLAPEAREDIETLIDCALLSHIHPQQIVDLIEEERYDLLRELVYRRAH